MIIKGYYPEKFVEKVTKEGAKYSEFIELSDLEDMRFKSENTEEFLFESTVSKEQFIEVKYRQSKTYYEVIRQNNGLFFKIAINGQYHYIIKCEAFTEGLLKLKTN